MLSFEKITNSPLIISSNFYPKIWVLIDFSANKRFPSNGSLSFLLEQHFGCEICLISSILPLLFLSGVDICKGAEKDKAGIGSWFVLSGNGSKMSQLWVVVKIRNGWGLVSLAQKRVGCGWWLKIEKSGVLS